ASIHRATHRLAGAPSPRRRRWASRTRELWRTGPREPRRTDVARTCALVRARSAGALPTECCRPVAVGRVCPHSGNWLFKLSRCPSLDLFDLMIKTQPVCSARLCGYIQGWMDHPTRQWLSISACFSVASRETRLCGCPTDGCRSMTSRSRFTHSALQSRDPSLLHPQPREDCEYDGAVTGEWFGRVLHDETDHPHPGRAELGALQSGHPSRFDHLCLGHCRY